MNEHPLPAAATTRDVLKALRAHLDATVPDWRGRVFESGEGRDAVEVEVHLQSGRVVRGALVQQASASGARGNRE
jgi:hypothetical protein